MKEETGNLNRETENIKKNQVEFLDFLKIIPEIKNALDGINSRYWMTEYKVNELEIRAVEIIQ